MTPVVVPVADLEAVKPGEVDVGGQLRPALKIIETPATHQPDGHVITRRERFERASDLIAQSRSGWIDVERRERSVEVREDDQTSSGRAGVDRRQHVGHHAPIVVTEPIHTTSSVQIGASTVARRIRAYSGMRPGPLSGQSCISAGDRFVMSLSARYRGVQRSERPQPYCEGRASVADAFGAFPQWPG